MTDMNCACLLKELAEYNKEGRMQTPAMEGFDTIFQCALEHGIRALEERSGHEPGTVCYVKNGNGSFSVKNGE